MKSSLSRKLGSNSQNANCAFNVARPSPEPRSPSGPPRSPYPVKSRHPRRLPVPHGLVPQGPSLCPKATRPSGRSSLVCQRRTARRSKHPTQTAWRVGWRRSRRRRWRRKGSSRVVTLGRTGRGFGSGLRRTGQVAAADLRRRGR